MQVPQVRAAARGRAWCGTEALDLGLVDSLGGYEKAVAMAKTLAGLPQVNLMRPGQPGIIFGFSLN